MKWLTVLAPILVVAQSTTDLSSITEVTGCHFHGTTQYCRAGGKEYEVLTKVDSTNAPTSYSGCHAHDEELHCSGELADVTLKPFTEEESSSHAGESSETVGSSTSASDGRDLPPGVSCHDHAGVPHCVDAQGNTVDLGCARPQNSYNIPLRIGLLFVILVTSSLGVFLPILTAHFTNFKYDHVVLIAIRQFGTGVIISTAIIHLFVHAQLYFSNECLGHLKYESTAGAILMAGLFVTFLVEYFSRRIFGVSGHNHHAIIPRTDKDDTTTTSTPVRAESPTDDVDNAIVEKNNAKLAALSVSVLELGIIFHSILIGITLVVADNSGFITLFVVILFHQVFEGLALGSRIATLDRDFSMARKILLALAFGLTTPVGMAIGIGVLSTFNGNDPSTIVAIGTLNAFSAGILLWVGVIEMWYGEWFGHGALARANLAKTSVGMVALVAGLALMSLLGKWA